jgi:hypothetical protein
MLLDYQAGWIFIFKNLKKQKCTPQIPSGCLASAILKRVAVRASN